jgi:hypothetical protein
MKAKLIAALALLVLPALGAVAAPPVLLLTDAPVDAEMLWNGHDLAGWTIFLKDPSVDPKYAWARNEGTLAFTGSPWGYVRTEKTYSNYYLHLEWRFPPDAQPKADSGVFVHVRGADKIWPTGIECQVKGGETGQLVATDLDIPSAPLVRGKKRANPTGAPADKPFGEWNTYDIFCRGATIEVYVNGVRENRVENVSATDGSIALQMEGSPIQFRNLWLEQVKPLQ